MTPLEQAMTEAVEHFKRAKAELVACGLPKDVVDAALRPLWHSIRLSADHYTEHGRSEG